MTSDKQAMTIVSKASAGLVTLALALTPASSSFGQTTPSGGTGGTSSSSTSTEHGSSSDPYQPATVSSYETAAITNNISAVRNECAKYDPRYRIDCLRQGLTEVARRIPERGDYSDTRRIIAQTAAKLGEVQNKYADNAAPEQTSEGNARFPAKRTYKAVKQEKLAVAMEEATKIIEEAETQLLRAAENSEKRSAHYQEIAAAIGSTKVLLRS